jgi:hypothetical protein
MRADMHKVVVERERGRSTWKNRKWGKRLPFVPDAEYEDQPKFVSSGRRRQYGSDCKWFTDVLEPLEGFLRSNLGRPWDKVYSELRQGLDVRKVTGQHIFDHLKSMVETDCWIGADRKIYSWGWRRGAEGFYVHPKSGLLCFVSRQSARERKKERLLRQEIDEVKLDRCHGYKLIEGQWYWVRYEYVDVGRGENCSRWDVVQRQHVKLTWGCHCIAISKRQCNREEVQWIHARIAAWEKEVRRM